MNQPVTNQRLSDLRHLQLTKLNRLLSLAKTRPFYRQRLAGIELPLTSLDQLSQLPLLTKSELISGSTNKLAGCFDLPKSEYCRFHQTSGTSGYPMVVTDTADDWRWWLDCWDHVLDAASVTDCDIAMMAFSFGPFIGFWTANDAMVRRGTLVIPGGGMSTETRLSVLVDQQCYGALLYTHVCVASSRSRAGPRFGFTIVKRFSNHRRWRTRRIDRIGSVADRRCLGS